METSSPAIERWQEYDCPNSGIDFDRDEADLVKLGQPFYCPGCGEEHIATAEIMQEYEQAAGEAPRAVPIGTWTIASLL